MSKYNTPADTNLIDIINNLRKDLDRLINRPLFTQQIRVFEATDTWEKPDGLRAVRIRLVGGGGGCGGAPSTGSGEASEGGGGGGGGYCEKIIPVDDLGATENIIVGTGGNGGTGGNNGGSGGNTSFGSHCTATGGFGGTGGITHAANASSIGGNGGSASGGDINLTGGDGGNGIIIGGESVKQNHGGSTILGNSVATAGFTSAGQTGHLYGVGGGGTRNNDNANSRTGTSGRHGVVIVDEYY